MSDKHSLLQEALVDAIVAGNLEAVKALIEQGVCTNTALDVANVTPLHFAAQQPDARIAELLLLHGASLDALTQPDQQTPRDIALLHDNTAVLRLFG